MKFKYSKNETYLLYDNLVKVFSDGRIEIRFYDDTIKKNLPFEEISAKDDYLSVLLDHVDPLPPSELEIPSYVPKVTEEKKGEVRSDSLSRSKRLIVDLIHENYLCWKSFVTLTFADIIDVKEGNSTFSKYVSRINKFCSRNNLPEFKYVAVPEYQKRGSIHYHFVSNLIPGGSDLIPERDFKSLWNPSLMKYINLQYYDLKYWNYGFSSALYFNCFADDRFSVEKYVTKYLFKDFDSRFFDRRKVLHSNNLKLPHTYNFSSGDNFKMNILKDLIKNNFVERYQYDKKYSYDKSYTEFICQVDPSQVDLFQLLLSTKENK